MAKILILTDEQEMNLLLELVLKKEGYECISIKTAAEVLFHFHDLDVDLGIFVLPLSESEPDGWDFYSQLKDDSNLSNIPIIIYTAWRNPKLPNPDNYGDILFTKPMRIRDLLATIKEILVTD